MDYASFSPEITFKFPRHQNFSIPQNFIYYLTKNPISFLGWKKLVKACKFFYSKNPLFVTNYLCSGPFLSNDILIEFNGKIDKIKHIDFKPIPFKFWVTDTFILCNSKIKNHDIIKKIYPFNLSVLRFKQETFIYEDLCFLASSSRSIQEVDFCDLAVIKSDGSIVEFDEILKLFPDIKEIFYYNFLSTDEINRMNKLPYFEKLIDFEILDITFEIDLEPFSIFMKKQKNTEFRLIFLEVSENYALKLQNFVENVIKEGENHTMQVVIDFPGMSDEMYRNISRLQFNRWGIYEAKGKEE